MTKAKLREIVVPLAKDNVAAMTILTAFEQYINSQNSGEPHVSGSLPVDLLRKAYNAGMVEAIKRRCAEEDNYEYKQVSFEMWLNSVTEADGNDR